MASQRTLALGLAALLVAAAPAAVHAQVRAMPGGGGPLPAGQTVGTIQNPATVGPGRGFANPSPTVVSNNNVSVAPGFSPGAYGPYFGDFSPGNTLQGAASVINAQGQLNIQNQQARLQQQQVEQEKVRTRQMQMEQYQYERANTPSVNDIREAQMQADLRRQRNDPPKTEIWSGSALNGILTAVQRTQGATGITGPAIPLSPDLVRQLNFSTGVSGAGVATLRGGNDMNWPLSLQGDLYKADREKINGLATQLVMQATAGRVDGQTLTKMNAAVAELKRKFNDRIDDMTPTDNIRGNRFLNDLAKASSSLEDPAAVNFFGKWRVEASNVSDLVSQMTTKGLTFAAAASGQEAAYNAVFQALSSYDMALGQMTARLRSPGR